METNAHLIVKEMRFRLSKTGELYPVFLLEDGRIIEMAYQATGSCWMSYFKFAEPPQQAEKEGV